MKEPQFDFKALAKQTFNDWKRFFRDNFVFTKVINTKEISEPIVEAIKNKEIPVVSAEEISSPIVNALYKVQESVEMKEGIEEVTVKNIGDAKADMTEVVSVLENIRDKEYPAFPEIPAQKESIKIDGEVVISKPSWFKPVDLSETNKTLKEIAKKEYPEFPKFPEFPSFADIFQKALSPIKDVLEKILAKPEKENPPFEFAEFGRVKVNVDRAGGGGGNPSVMLETKNGEILNPATEETLQEIESTLFWLRRISKQLEPSSAADSQNRQRVAVDYITGTTLGSSIAGPTTGGGTPIVNVPTPYAPTNPTSTTYWQQVWVGPVDQRWQIADQARNAYANGIRSNLSFS